MTDQTKTTRALRIYVRVNAEEYARLQREADAEGRKLSQLVRWRLFAAKG